MKDVIYRQSAINLLKKWADGYQYIETDAELAIIEFQELPSAQPEQKWIPCSERLPRQEQEVICQCRANMIRVLKLDAYGDWYQDAKHCYMSGFVIAWMPLPEPYRKDGD